MKHWSQLEETSVVWGMRFLLQVYVVLGRRALQFFLHPVVSYYWLLNATGRQASRRYLQRLSAYCLDHQLPQPVFNSYQHFMSFSNAIIDKLAALSGSIPLDEIDVQGRETLIGHLKQGAGVLILCSHLGNLEVLRAIARLRQEITINVLVHTRHAEKFNALLNQYDTANRLNLMQVTSTNAATAMLLQDKIDAGELVIIAADRTPVSGQNRVSRAVFLGEHANFPQGPFILAALLKCPVYTVFCLKQQRRHTIYFDWFSDCITLPRQYREATLQKIIQDYANRLQHYCLKAPRQWFNFYDFWQTAHE